MSGAPAEWERGARLRIAAVARACRRALGSGWVKETAAELAAHNGWSERMIGWGLAHAVRQLTERQMRGVVRAELGGGAMSIVPVESPRLLLQVLAAGAPGAAVEALAAGVIAGGPQRVKCSSSDPVTARRFARLLAEECGEAVPEIGVVEPALWEEWGMGRCAEGVTHAAVYGGDEAMAAWRSSLGGGCRMVEYGARVSFAVVAGAGGGARAGARALARDVAAWEQGGCMSPRMVYVEAESGVGGREFALLLSEELRRRAEEWPIGGKGGDGVGTARAVAERLAAMTGEVFRSGGGTVAVGAGGAFEASPGGRFVWVRECGREEWKAGVRGLGGSVSTVGVWPAGSVGELAHETSFLSPARVTLVGRMQLPQFLRRQDGQGWLAPLLR